MTVAQIYIHSDVYHQTLDRLEAIARTFDPAAPVDVRSQLIEALGEIANVWPIEIFSGEDEGKIILAA